MNDALKAKTFSYEIEPVNLTFAEDVTIKATYKKQKVKILPNGETAGEDDTGYNVKKKKCIQVKDDGTLNKVKSVKVKAWINGISYEDANGKKKKLKTYTISTKYVKNRDASKNWVKISVTDKVKNIVDIETLDACTNFFGKYKNVIVKK